MPAQPTTTTCPECYRPPIATDDQPACGCHLGPHRYVPNPSGNKSCARCARGGTAKVHRAAR